MSFQAMALAMRVKGLTTSEKLTLLMLANYADERLTCFPSQRTLSEDTGLSDKWLRQVLSSLESRGIIARQERRRDDGSRSSDLIRLVGFSGVEESSGGGELTSGGVGNSLPEGGELTSPHEPITYPINPNLPPSTNVDVPPSGAKVKAVRGTRLPEDWEPSERDRMVARGEGLTEEDIDRAAREFRNYWCARSRDATRISWPRTWENRIIEIGERLRRDRARLASRPAVNGHGGSGVADFATIVAKRRGFAAE